jgi:hypothetical protein
MKPARCRVSHALPELGMPFSPQCSILVCVVAEEKIRMYGPMLHALSSSAGGHSHLCSSLSTEKGLAEGSWTVPMSAQYAATLPAHSLKRLRYDVLLVCCAGFSTTVALHLCCCPFAVLLHAPHCLLPLHADLRQNALCNPALPLTQLSSHPQCGAGVMLHRSLMLMSSQLHSRTRPFSKL